MPTKLASTKQLPAPGDDDSAPSRGQKRLAVPEASAASAASSSGEPPATKRQRSFPQEAAEVGGFCGGVGKMYEKCLRKKYKQKCLEVILIWMLR